MERGRRLQGGEEFGGMTLAVECAPLKWWESAEKVYEVPERWTKAKFIPLEKGKGSSGK